MMIWRDDDVDADADADDVGIFVGFVCFEVNQSLMHSFISLSCKNDDGPII